MKFSTVQAKGLDQCFVAESIDPQKLCIHISEVEPGSRSHSSHTHTGVEAFYMLEGHATIEVEDQRYPLGPNQVIVLDPSRPHGISNAGSTRMRYMVIIAQ